MNISLLIPPFFRTSFYKRTSKSITVDHNATKENSKKNRQTGHSVTSGDNQRKARLPGKRVSKAGNVYLERRKNRSDTPAKETV